QQSQSPPPPDTVHKVPVAADSAHPAAPDSAHPGPTVIQTQVQSISLPMSAGAPGSQATAAAAAAVVPPSSSNPPVTSAAAPPTPTKAPADSASPAAAPEPAGPVLPVGTTIPLERVVAIVGDQPVLWSNVLENINVRRAQGMPIPEDSAGQIAVITEVV